MKNICKILLFTTLATIGNIVWGAEDTPEAVAETFFEELLNGDVHKAMDLVYIPPELAEKESSKEKANYKVTDLARPAKRAAEIEGGIEKVSVQEVIYKNRDNKNLAFVDLLIKSPKYPEGRTLEIPLIKTENGWRVDFSLASL